MFSSLSPLFSLRSTPSQSSEASSSLVAASPSATPPHLLQRLNADLRREFLERYVATGSGTREAAVKLRAWAGISKAHRSEVIGLLNEPGYVRVSMMATYRALSKSVDFTVLPWNSREKLEQELRHLASQYSSLHLDLGKAATWLHLWVAHFDALGVLFTHPHAKCLVLDFSGADSGTLLVKSCIGQLRQAAAVERTAPVPSLNMHWHRADPDRAISTLFMALAEEQLIADQFDLVSLAGLGTSGIPGAPIALPESLLSYLERTRKLATLALRRVRLSGQLAPLLAALEKNGSVRRVDLGHCRLVDNDAGLLAGFLARRANICVVLDANRIGRDHPIWLHSCVSGCPVD